MNTVTCRQTRSAQSIDPRPIGSDRPPALPTPRSALQCGFCTPGFLMLAEGFLAERPSATKGEIRELVAANLCRCYALLVRQPTRRICGLSACRELSPADDVARRAVLAALTRNDATYVTAAPTRSSLLAAPTT